MTFKNYYVYLIKEIENFFHTKEIDIIQEEDLNDEFCLSVNIRDVDICVPMRFILEGFCNACRVNEEEEFLYSIDDVLFTISEAYFEVLSKYEDFDDYE